jgi:uncharacterized membrane protein YdjX (TVP38/TMEM64 family)
MRLFWIALALAVLLCIPFLLWGEGFTQWFSGETAVRWIRGWGQWGWLAIILLLMSDLFLPIPATAVMAAAGYVYGPWIGGLLSACGSICAGLLGYGLCRAFGERAALRLVGERELREHAARFRRQGGWFVAASRWLPLLPEVITCLAGLTKMPAPSFLAALACGALPMGFVYAAIGASGQEHPGIAVGLSLLVPPLLWAAARPFLRSHEDRPDAERP